jgi:hypothetical protein
MRTSWDGAGADGAQNGAQDGIECGSVGDMGEQSRAFIHNV